MGAKAKERNIKDKVMWLAGGLKIRGIQVWHTESEDKNTRSSLDRRGETLVRRNWGILIGLTMSSMRNRENPKHDQHLECENECIRDCARGYVNHLNSILIYMLYILCIHMWCKSPFSTDLHRSDHVPHCQCSQSCSDGPQAF